MTSLLIIEDDENLRDLFSEYLSNLYDIFLAQNGIEGLEIYKNKNIDLIISDIDMPKMNGLEFLKIVRKIETRTPIIIMTASESHNETEIISLGANDFWKKTEIDFDNIHQNLHCILTKISFIKAG